MIIELLLDLIYNILSILTSPIRLPNLPDSVNSVLTSAFDYIQAGAGILANYTDLGYLLSLLSIIMAIDIGIKLYHFVMWIVKKIPMLGIE